MKSIKYFFVCTILSLYTHISAASEDEPHLFFEQKIKEVLAMVNKNYSEYSKDKEALYAMVRKNVVPHVDMRRVGRLILKRSWRKATEDQRSRFSKVFMELLIKTHADALMEHADTDILESKTRYTKKGIAYVTMDFSWYDVSVGDSIVVSMSYVVRRDDKTKWKAFDVLFNGLSFTHAKYLKYRKLIRENGLESVLYSLEKKARIVHVAGQ